MDGQRGGAAGLPTRTPPLLLPPQEGPGVPQGGGAGGAVDVGAAPTFRLPPPTPRMPVRTRLGSATSRAAGGAQLSAAAAGPPVSPGGRGGAHKEIEEVVPGEGEGRGVSLGVSPRPVIGSGMRPPLATATAGQGQRSPPGLDLRAAVPVRDFRTVMQLAQGGRGGAGSGREAGGVRGGAEGGEEMGRPTGWGTLRRHISIQARTATPPMQDPGA